MVENSDLEGDQTSSRIAIETLRSWKQGASDRQCLQLADKLEALAKDQTSSRSQPISGSVPLPVGEAAADEVKDLIALGDELQAAASGGFPATGRYLRELCGRAYAALTGAAR